MGLGVVDAPTACEHVARGSQAQLLEAPLAMQLSLVRPSATGASAAPGTLLPQCDAVLATHKVS